MTQALIEQNQTRTRKIVEQKQESSQHAETNIVTNGEINPLIDDEAKSEEIRKLDEQAVEDTKDQLDISKVNDSLPDHLWSQVQHAKQGSQTFDSAPLHEIDADKPQFHFNSNSLYAEMGSQ